MEGHKILDECSRATHYVDLASGNADLILECTRKGNLEMAAAYGLITEAGGVMVTSDGFSIKNKRYLELGQKDYLPIVIASTIELAKELLDKLKWLEKREPQLQEF